MGLCHRALPSVVYLGGLFYSAEGASWDQSPHEAMAVENGKITFLGTEAEAEAGGHFKEGTKEWQSHGAKSSFFFFQKRKPFYHRRLWIWEVSPSCPASTTFTCTRWRWEVL